MACTKFKKIWLRIDGEIDEKHALQIYQNNCVLDYTGTIVYSLPKEYNVVPV